MLRTCLMLAAILSMLVGPSATAQQVATPPADAASGPQAAASGGLPASSAGTSTPVIVDDKTNFASDRIKFQDAIPVRKLGPVKDNKSADLTWACAPAFTTLRGIGKRQVDKETLPEFKVTHVAADEAKRCGAPQVNVGDTVLVDISTITSTPPDRFGLTYGPLIVPYKRQVKGEGELYSKASVGGYVGYRQERSGIGLGLQYVAFVGVAPIEVSQTLGGTQTSQTLTGLSYGVGILGLVKNEFPIGLVLGADRVNKSAGYKYNDKPWIAISFGF